MKTRTETGRGPGGIPGTETSGSARRWRNAFIASTAILLAAVLFLSYQLFLATSDEEVSRELEAVARDFAQKLTNYDAATVDQHISSVKEMATGQFLEEYEQALAGETFRNTIVEAEAKSEGRVVVANAGEVEGDRALVIVILEQTTSNRARQAESIKLNRLELTLVKTDDGWKVERAVVRELT